MRLLDQYWSFTAVFILFIQTAWLAIIRRKVGRLKMKFGRFRKCFEVAKLMKICFCVFWQQMPVQEEIYDLWKWCEIEIQICYFHTQMYLINI
jgi:hypothetical protein